MAGHEMKEQSKERAILISVGIACVLVAYFILIKPALAEIHVLRESIRTSRSRMDLYKEIVTLSAKEKGLKAMFEDQSNKSLLIGKVADIASKERIRVQSVTPKDEPAGGYTKLTLELDLRSPFMAVVRYLKAFDSLKPVFRVKDVSITKENRGPDSAMNKGPKLVQSRLVLETLLLKKAVKV